MWGFFLSLVLRSDSKMSHYSKKDKKVVSLITDAGIERNKINLFEKSFIM